ncbi:MAG: preprotein translocase subunit SecY [Chloroflexi bacterium]|nr:preprotein translocase subunit SecY [Chloroflexota bacterium]MCL5950506.1 preprotein translocase subunit SecY [Chloroflexota bacterium]
MIDAVRNAMRLPDLRNKILFTLLILIIYRLAAHIPVPGVNPTALTTLFNSNQLLGFLDLFSGGALSNFSIVAMGVYPYITATIIMQLATGIIPSLEKLQKEGGDAGRQRLDQITHLITIPLAALQGFGQALVLTQSNPPVLTQFGLTTFPLQTIAIIVTLTAGTIFAMWLGELISEQGIGSGISIIIFGGIVAAIPQRVGQMIQSNPTSLIFFVVITIITIVGIVYIQEGHRRVPVQYGKRVRGTKMYGGQSTHIPLRVNSAGMIPLIFAISILIFPGVIAGYFAAPPGQPQNLANLIVNAFNQNSPVYWVVYFFMVIGFTYFYTDVIFRQQNLPEVLQQQGGFIPGIRPGKRTEDYLNGVLQRITLVGAVFLGVVAVLPFLIQDVSETNTLIITSTGLLIVVGVVLDTMKQLQAQLLMRHYEGFIK